MTPWQVLNFDDPRYDAIWAQFHERFRFRPSIYADQWPGIREPTPSVTYDISGHWGEGYRASNHAALHQQALEAFRACVHPGEWIYALDWQHPCYQYYPHREGSYWSPFNASEEEWPVPVIPDGDYFIFVPPDLSWGWFGHPWEQTICIWGENLLGLMAKSKPLLFNQIQRQRP